MKTHFFKLFSSVMICSAFSLSALNAMDPTTEDKQEQTRATKTKTLTRKGAVACLLPPINTPSSNQSTSQPKKDLLENIGTTDLNDSTVVLHIPGTQSPQ